MLDQVEGFEAFNTAPMDVRVQSCFDLRYREGRYGMSNEKEILALEDKRFAAMILGDWKTVQGLAHDQLLYTHSSAITDTKATWLESMTSGKAKYKSANFTDRKVRMIGDAALVTGGAAIEAEINGQPRSL